MNTKDRNPWLAGVFTVFTIGLGHLYTGQAKKGILLFFIGQGALLAVGLPLIYYFPSAPTFVIVFLIGVAFFIYCVFDAVSLARRYKYGYTIKRYNRWYIYLGCWILASFMIQPMVSSFIKEFFVQAYKLQANSLMPTILKGDRILAKKRFAMKEGIKRGDIVVFPYPKDVSKDYIKRVIATGGETIEIINNEVFINGNLLREPYVIHADPQIIPEDSLNKDNFGPVSVPESALFVMGDNRDQSLDSRYWGFVEKSSVKGKAYTIYWSWDKAGHKVRWNRIGKEIE